MNTPYSDLKSPLTRDIKKAAESGSIEAYRSEIEAARNKATELMKLVFNAKEVMSPRDGGEPIYRLLEEVKTFEEALRLECFRASGEEKQFLHYLHEDASGLRKRGYWRE